MSININNNRLKLHYFHLIVFYSMYLFASTTLASIVYSGPLNIDGPDFRIDLNKDGEIDLVSSWRTRSLGFPFGGSSAFDIEPTFGLQFIHTELTGQSYFPGAKAPLISGTIIGPLAPPDLKWAYSSSDGMLWNTYGSISDPIEYDGKWHNLTNRKTEEYWTIQELN